MVLSLDSEEVSRKPSSRKRPDKSRIISLVIFFNILMIGILAAVWLTSADIRSSKHLLVLFFYMFPSHFLIAVLPHEPVVIYFGKFHTPLTVASVAVIGTVMIEMINYAIIKFASELKTLERIRLSRFTQKIIALFNNMPFFALLAAGISPVPFYPFRFLVVLARYSPMKFALSVLISRFGRFYLLSSLGNWIRIPDGLLMAIFVLILVASNAALVGMRRRKPAAESHFP